MKRREKRNRKKKNVRRIILVIIFCILIYTGYGIYKERKIRFIGKDEVIADTLEDVRDSTEEVKEETQSLSLIEEMYEGYNVCAKLEIPIINLKLYVFSDYSVEAMKISAIKFWGPEPNEIGNFCIAGHNKEGMFNHLINLEIGDEIYLTDNKNGTCTYTIYDIYKVKPENTEPIEQDTNGEKIVTLITCTNYSKNRLIVKARD